MQVKTTLEDILVNEPLPKLCQFSAFIVAIIAVFHFLHVVEFLWHPILEDFSLIALFSTF